MVDVDKFLDNIDHFVVMAGCYFIYCMSYLCMFINLICLIIILKSVL
jgi:hypothetical protein